jgi:hypothetical protein
MTHTKRRAENADELTKMRIAHTHWVNGQYDRLVAGHMGGGGEVRTAMQTVCMKWSTGADGRHRRRTAARCRAASGRCAGVLPRRRRLPSHTVHRAGRRLVPRRSGI